MAQKATLKDVADAAGVAESTVSRAFSGQVPISEDTRARIMAAAEALNYQPKRKRAKDGGSERKGVIGVVVAALHNAFYPSLLDRLHTELDALGYDMILIIDDLSNVAGGRKIQSLIDTALDGVIFTTASIDSPAVDLLVEREIPTALAIRSNQRGNVDVIESDNRVAGEEAVRHLLELGHRRIGFVLGPKETSTAQDRFAGGMAVLKGAGLSLAPEHLLWSDYSHAGGYSGMVGLLGLSNSPTAVVCGNDVIAIGALDACNKLGVKVPEAVSIIGFDDITMASWTMVSLTTIRQAIGEIGALAARRIVARIESGNRAQPIHDVLPTSLVRRNSTAAPA